MYQWKLLNHVSRDHHMTLKPAHLSYKCTVCTATFGMYKQFETHVYTAHSTVAKKAMDGKKNSPVPNSAVASSSGRNSLSAANDSLLKPLKINDEITIIPQPASKSRISNMDTHVIGKLKEIFNNFFYSFHLCVIVRKFGNQVRLLNEIEIYCNPNYNNINNNKDLI